MCIFYDAYFGSVVSVCWTPKLRFGSVITTAYSQQDSDSPLALMSGIRIRASSKFLSYDGTERSWSGARRRVSRRRDRVITETAVLSLFQYSLPSVRAIHCLD
jgi:hypothetical protein